MRAFIVPIVVEEIGRLTTTSDVYSTAPDGARPRGWSRRRLAEQLRRHPKARRSGGKRGRGVIWEIDRVDFEAPAESPAANVVDLDAWLSGAGLRATRTA